MKNIFTSISLVAVLLITALMPVAAQKQQMTNKQKATYARLIVPQMLKQVELISGIDLMALATPDIETVISSSLFGTQSSSKAAAPVAISIKPDSMNLDLSSLIDDPMGQTFLKDIKLTFAGYKEFSVITAEGRPVNINIPQQIVASVIGMPITLNIKLGDKSDLLPFNSLEATVDFGVLKEIIEQMGIKGSALLKMTESSATGVYNYNITLGECLRSILKMSGITEADALPNYKINVDMTKVAAAGTINASLKGIFTLPTHVELPMGDAKVFLNKATAAADSIILTSYEEGTIKVDGYKKIVSSIKFDAALKGFTYETVDSVATASAPQSWTLDATSTLDATTNQPVDPKNLVRSIFNGLIKDILNVKPVASFTLNAKSKEAAEAEEQVMYVEVETSISGTLQQQQGNIVVSIFDKKNGTETMKINIMLPIKGDIIKAEFQTGSNKVGTMFIKSNAMQIVTNNETTPVLENLAIYPQAGGLYVENGGNSDYAVVGINGAFVAQGKIAGSNEYIATPSLVRGNIYVVSIVKENTRKSFKFKAK